MALTFLHPSLLAALLLLPLLWFLLKSIPPSPKREKFPGIILLIALKVNKNTPAKTPFWLMLLRLSMLTFLIIGLSEPVLSPREQPAQPDHEKPPLLVLIDASWASAGNWVAIRNQAEIFVENAIHAKRPLAVRYTTDPKTPVFLETTHQADLVISQPHPFGKSEPRLIDWIVNLPETPFETIWFHDGLNHPSNIALLEALSAKGQIRIIVPSAPLLALYPPQKSGNELLLSATRAGEELDPEEFPLALFGLDPSGNTTQLAEARLVFSENSTIAEAQLELPNEILGRLKEIRLAGIEGPNSRLPIIHTLKSPEIGLLNREASNERNALLDPHHYLRSALQDIGVIIEGQLDVILPTQPDVIVLTGTTGLSEKDEAALEAWVMQGGKLLRFSGIALTRQREQSPFSSEQSRRFSPLLPVRLRQNTGRNLDGLMRWEEAQQLAAFPEQSPFAGLDIPEDIEVRNQVLAEPGPELAAASIALLQDGTPLVTRAYIGSGQVILFHVSANAEWSNLPLSGLFLDMLRRLIVPSAFSLGLPEDQPQGLWRADTLLDSDGILSITPEIPLEIPLEIPAQQLFQGTTSIDLPAGLYRSGEQQIMRPLLLPNQKIELADWAESAPVEPLSPQSRIQFPGPYLLLMAAFLLLVDTLIMLFSHISLKKPQFMLLIISFFALNLIGVQAPFAQSIASSPTGNATEIASQTRFGYVLTGDNRLDRISGEGLSGLSQILTQRSSVEPGSAISVNLEQDDMAMLALLYWPVTPEQPIPSPSAYQRLRLFIERGGIILFDTRDGDFVDPDGVIQSHLGTLIAPLSLPGLYAMPENHVLTRSFYLLAELSGRHRVQTIWIVQDGADATEELRPGLQIDRRDGVSPVIIGGGDWAAAWALGENGQPLYSLGRRFEGEIQREMAWRFGVNLVMYALTGNYKSDQVHISDLLEKLSP